MKNFISLFTLATILFLTSCGKEELLQPKTIAEPGIELQDETMLLANSARAIKATNDPLSLTLEIEVSQVQISTFAGELFVEFSSSYDFTGEELENIQTLSFSDANNNDYYLDFGVNGYVGSNGNLQAVFDIGQNNLTGLSLKLIQSIIIADDIMD